jgi:hypothetical protein
VAKRWTRRADGRHSADPVGTAQRDHCVLGHELPDHVDIEEQTRAHGDLIAALLRAILELADEIEQLKERD